MANAPALHADYRTALCRASCQEWTDLPFAVALFVGNAASVLLLNCLVPRISGQFAWWLQPEGLQASKTDFAEAALFGNALRRDDRPLLAPVLTGRTG
ncbi:hypothetical protein [Methylocystis sp. B8]|uniref:hypothetical protein n=1 Tax=Methylocystis sp. B8 TaxID=544938 RepID=UPI00126C86FD|nr:hypothetical protein [Methylocystis sp. B8]TLG77795.1 hypothetical protein FEV16_08210 [Methylocystis sp. B8]